jgi:hypothetical protein
MITWRSKSNTGLIDTTVDVDSKETIMGNTVDHNEGDMNIEAHTATEAEIILSTEAHTVSNFDNAQSRSATFVANLDVGQ